jgi:hypothetical protein
MLLTQQSLIDKNDKQTPRDWHKQRILWVEVFLLTEEKVTKDATEAHRLLKSATSTFSGLCD